MKIFVYEYVCATWRPGTEASRAAGLLAEGRAMRDAAFADATAIPGADVRTLDAVGNERSEFNRLAEWCDYALIIAPEFDDILTTRIRWAEACGAKLLGPSSAAAALCGDKLALAEVWNHSDVPTPNTKLFDPSAFALPVVVKPRFGAGSEDVWFIDNSDRLKVYRPSASGIVQPFVDGIAASVSCLVSPRHTVALKPCYQHVRIRADGKMEYAGGRTMCDANLVVVAQALALRAIKAVSGLKGYVGVDMVLGPRPMALEINPRLTTSYVGLRRACRQNLLELIIALAAGETVESPTWHEEPVAFDTMGNVMMA